MGLFGMLNTKDLVTDERPLHWQLGIVEAYPNAAPLINMMLRLKKDSEVSIDPEFNWWERDLATRTFQLAADVAAGNAGDTVTLTLASGAQECPKWTTIRHVSTGEIMRVNSDPTSDTSMSVTRGIGETGTVPALSTNDWLHVVAMAAPEGDSVPTAISRRPTKKNNYLQIFRTSTNNTETALRTRLRTAQLRTQAKKDALKDHMIEKERAAIYGKPSEDTVSGEVVRTTGGMLHFSTGHNWTIASGGTWTFNDFRDWFFEVMEDGSDEKIAFGGSDAIQGLYAMFEDKGARFYDPNPSDTFGMNIARVSFKGGTIYFMEHKLMTKTPGDEELLVVVDPDRLGYKYLSGRDTNWLPNRQNPGDDKNIGEWLAEIGFQFELATTVNGVIRGLSASKYA